MKLFNKIKFTLANKPWIVIGVIILLGLFLRTLNLKDHVIFAYDQARDAQRIMGMVYGHDLKLVGPETDISGVFNGILFYLLMLPIYALTHFDPNAASLFLVILNLVMIPLLYYFSLILFKNKYVGYIAGFLWAISFEQINFAKYISNASLMPLTTTVFFLGLAIYLFQKKEWGLIVSIVGLATSIHFNFYLVYLFVFYPLFFLIYRPTFRVKTFVISAFIFILIISPFIIAEIRWHFPAIKGLTNYFINHTKEGEGFNLLTMLKKYYDRIAEMNYFSFFSFQRDIGTVLIYTLSFFALNKLKNKIKIFAALCLFSTLPLFIFNSGVLTVPVINSSIFFIITLTVASGIYLAGSKNKIFLFVLLGLVFFSNFLLYKKDDFKINTLFASHPLTNGLEKKAIDYMYQSSNKSFSFCSVSNPLFFNTIWSFMFKTYGERKYGYLPVWSGQRQDMNINYLSDDTSHLTERFLLIEPLVGIPRFAKNITIYLEDKNSSLIAEKHFDQFIVQKRQRYPIRGTTFIDTQKLASGEINSIKSVTAGLKEPRYYCYTD